MKNIRGYQVYKYYVIVFCLKKFLHWNYPHSLDFRSAPISEFGQ